MGDFGSGSFVAHVPRSLVQDDPFVYHGQLAPTENTVVKAELEPMANAATPTIVTDDLGSPQEIGRALRSQARLGRPVTRTLLSGGLGWLGLLKPAATDSPSEPDYELKKG